MIRSRAVYLFIQMHFDDYRYYFYHLLKLNSCTYKKNRNLSAEYISKYKVNGVKQLTMVFFFCLHVIQSSFIMQE